ncbi:MAG: hypothetical protein ABI587_07630 [Gemmatimonadales bacterium]
MIRTMFRTALLALTLIALAPPAAQAQGLAALAVATSTSGGGESSALREKAGCWDCVTAGQVYNCMGGQVPGYWNCSVTLYGCNRSSSGCGHSASIPVDIDGAAQYVSRNVIRLQESSEEPGEPGEERNCDGVIVARQQSPDNIAAVRNRTAALSL